MGPHFYKIFKGKNAIKFVKKKKKSGKKKIKKKKTKKCPALLRLLYFLPLITGPYDLTIASVVSVLGFRYAIIILTQKFLMTIEVFILQRRVS